MPLDEFIQDYDEHPFELLNGERIPRLPSVFGHSETLMTMFRALDAYAIAQGTGNAYSETTFILPDADEQNWVKDSRIPDVMFYVGKRIADYKQAHPDHRVRPLALVPDVVVEVVSPNDKISAMDANGLSH
jgi:Uma2 family endonuclease